MIKVLRIITRLNIGGPAIHTILLSSTLNKKGFYKNILICGKVSDSEGDMAYFAKDKGLEPVVIPALVRDISLKKDISAFLNLYSIIKKEKPDIVHTHMAKAGALGRLAAIFAGVPVKIHTFHGHVFDGYFNPFRTKLFILIERFLALFTDRVIAVSEYVRNDIVDRLKVTNHGKCTVIPLGLDLEKFLDCEKKKGIFKKNFGIEESTLLIGIVGRLAPIKNHRMFLDIARKIKTDFSNIKVKFVIVGDGELREQIKNYTYKLGLKEDVVFTGWIEDLASVYADLDIVVLTSLNEGTPLSLIEAMAAGKPVIATDVGGVKDLIDANVNGFLINQKDIEDFSAKLVQLLDDYEQRRNFGIKGRDFALKKYSKQRLIRDTQSLYSDLVAKKLNK